LKKREKAPAPVLSEAEAIKRLQALARVWPRKKLWLFSGGGTLWVMRYDADGERLTVPDPHGDTMDPEAAIAQIDIPNDGGDW
jgi:hypothetical protein